MPGQKPATSPIARDLEVSTSANVSAPGSVFGEQAVRFDQSIVYAAILNVVEGVSDERLAA
jgi:hypothetical protein